MRLLQQRDQVIWALGNITVSIGLAGLPGAVKAAPSPSAPPIVALEFDDASGKLWKATSRSLAHSHDEGRTWKSVALPAAAQGNIASLTISAGRPKTIYVAVVGSGVLHSHDGGRTWLSRNRGLTNSGVVALAAHAAVTSCTDYRTRQHAVQPAVWGHQWQIDSQQRPGRHLGICCRVTCAGRVYLY